MGISRSIDPSVMPTHRQRRSIRFSVPGPQMRLASSVLGVALVFGVLFAANSYAAYARLFGATLSLAPKVLVAEIAEQTHHYLAVSAVLLVGLVFAVGAVSVATLHRLLGPLVAIERHVQALSAGHYTARLELRTSDAVFATVARQLNDLARELERGGARR